MCFRLKPPRSFLSPETVEVLESYFASWNLCVRMKVEILDNGFWVLTLIGRFMGLIPWYSHQRPSANREHMLKWLLSATYITILLLHNICLLYHVVVTRHFRSFDEMTIKLMMVFTIIHSIGNRLIFIYYAYMKGEQLLLWKQVSEWITINTRQVKLFAVIRTVVAIVEVSLIMLVFSNTLDAGLTNDFNEMNGVPEFYLFSYPVIYLAQLYPELTFNFQTMVLSHAFASMGKQVRKAIEASDTLSRTANEEVVFVNRKNSVSGCSVQCVGEEREGNSGCVIHQEARGGDKAHINSDVLLDMTGEEDPPFKERSISMDKGSMRYEMQISENRRNLSGTLQVLYGRHVNLCDLTSAMDNLLSPMMLMGLLMSGLIWCVAAYFLIVSYVAEMPMLYLRKTGCVVLMVDAFLRLFFICSIGHNLVVQAQAPLDHLYRCNVLKLDSASNTMVHRFISKLTSRPPQMTVGYGTFVINKTTMLAIMGVIATYVAVCVEVKLADYELDEEQAADNCSLFREMMED